MSGVITSHLIAIVLTEDKGVYQFFLNEEWALIMFCNIMCSFFCSFNFFASFNSYKMKHIIRLLWTCNDMHEFVTVVCYIAEIDGKLIKIIESKRT